MFCPQCGNEVPEGSGFCGKCGTPVNQGSVSAAGSAVFTGAASSGAPAGAAAAMKKPVLPIAIAVIVIAVIAVAVVTGGFGLLGSNVDPKDTVEEYTWEELSTISNKIAKASDEDEAIEIAKTYNLVNEDGTLDGTQTKSVTLTDGTVTSVQIAGFAHDDKSDGSGKAGITFIFTDAISEMYMNSEGNSNIGWESSDMRSWLASEGKALLPEELQDVLVAVDKSANNVGYVEESDDLDDISSIVTTTSDELWLLSYVELVGKLDESSSSYNAVFNAEGSQYKLFSDYGLTSDSDSDDILAKTYQGDSCCWWQRSQVPFLLIPSFMLVESSGQTVSGGEFYFVDVSLGVVPGFCI